MPQKSSFFGKEEKVRKGSKIKLQNHKIVTLPEKSLRRGIVPGNQKLQPIEHKRQRSDMVKLSHLHSDINISKRSDEESK